MKTRVCHFVRRRASVNTSDAGESTASPRSYSPMRLRISVSQAASTSGEDHSCSDSRSPSASCARSSGGRWLARADNSASKLDIDILRKTIELNKFTRLGTRAHQVQVRFPCVVRVSVPEVLLLTAALPLPATLGLRMSPRLRQFPDRFCGRLRKLFVGQATLFRTKQTREQLRPRTTVSTLSQTATRKLR